MNNWIEVSEPRLTANFRAIQAAAPEATVLAVIKANAYGHGAELCAPILARAGATWLGVTCASEGARIRAALKAACFAPDTQPEILVMSGFLPADVPLLHQHALTPVVWTPEHIAWLVNSPGIRVHVEVDTGMGRQGVTPGPALDLLLAQLTASQLILDGIFTHLCSSEIAGSPLSALQQQRFQAAIDQVLASNLKPAWIHLCNSSAIDNPPAAASWLADLAASIGARTLVRAGLALYGYTLPIEALSTGQPATPAAPRLRPALQPVMTWKAHVLAVRDLAPGETVGYNATFTAAQPMRVALLPVGYADGLRRELSSANHRPGGWVTLHGNPAPILGRISMNLTVVDITHIAGVSPGDEAVILGDTINADDHAALAHTIAYEILCGIHPCN